MRCNWSDLPFSILSDVAGHFIGRIFLLTGTLAIAAHLGAGLAFAAAGHSGEWPFGPALYPIMFIGGLVQGWGIASLFLLGIFAVVYLQKDDVPLKWLAVPFLIQGLEAYRWCSTLSHHFG